MMTQAVYRRLCRITATQRCLGAQKLLKTRKKGFFGGGPPLVPPYGRLRAKKTAWALLNMIFRGKKHVLVVSPETNKMGAADPVASS